MKKFVSRLNNLSNNNGFSLIELIVILAIISVLVGGAAIGMGLVSTRSATQCAENMRIGLEKCRASTMGKKNGYIAFYEGSDGIYMLERYDYSGAPIIDPSDPSKYTSLKRIGKSDVSVSYGGSAGTDFSLSSGGLIVVFNRSDGSVQGGDVTIQVKKNRREYFIKVDELTGRVTLN